MSFIQQHIYLFLLVLMITEGPITSFISAGFAAHGILHIEYIIGLAFLGDIVGDASFYVIGRFFHRIGWIKKFHYFVTQKNILKKIFDRSPFLYFLIVKITPYLAMPSLISLGIKKMKFLSFLKYSLIISLIVKTVYITLGYLGGISLTQLSRFLDGRKMAIIYILAGTAIFWGIRRGYRRLSQTIKDKIKSEK